MTANALSLEANKERKNEIIVEEKLLQKEGLELNELFWKPNKYKTAEVNTLLLTNLVQMKTGLSGSTGHILGISVLRVSLERKRTKIYPQNISVEAS